MDILAMVRSANSKNASDIHLVIPNPPIFRIHGALQPQTDLEPLTEESIAEAFNQITTPEERAEFEHYRELDFGCDVTEVGRIRCNAARQRGTISLVIRLIRSKIPTIEEFGLPEVCKDLVMRPRGLVIVTGPTGSGKSTTLAAMINYLNLTEKRRVVTVEDPIEYVYTSNKCTITQRELGADTLSFAEALRHVLRQDPDVILVGEMRDLDTASAALTIAETGHLVLTTGHATSAYQAVERVIDLFPPHERALAQSRLASLLLGIFCQVLVPKLDGSGRKAAIEIMMATPAVRNNIREGKVYLIPNTMLTQTRQGMVLLDHALVDLLRKGIISRENVMAFCNDENEIVKLMGNIGEADSRIIKLNPV